MKRVQTMVQLSEDILDELDAEATRQGASRSAVIREAVSSYLAGSRASRLDELIVDGYTRIPQGTPDQWGDLRAEADRHAEEMLARLAAEQEQGWE